MDIASIRTDYALKSLDISSLSPSPTQQFERWFAEALKAKVMEPNAMHLSTVSTDGRPSGRIVLLKEVDHGFVFYTNYQSNKGQELAKNPYAALTFFWPELQRQVRVEGQVEKVNNEMSDEYFLSRPEGSQIGAWASPQSQEIPNREFLEANEKKNRQRFQNEPLKRPSHWGGYRVLPDKVEFWQGRQSRLHDRILYRLIDDASWQQVRLAP